MRPKSRTHPEAAAELQEAARWYDDEQAGVGDDFLSAAEAAVRGILDWPQAGAPFPGWKDEPMVRSRHMKVFPYRVLYYIEGVRVTFLAFAHEKRKPGYWAPRYTDQF